MNGIGKSTKKNIGNSQSHYMRLGPQATVDYSAGLIIEDISHDTSKDES